jgi:hypothetical protein
MTFEEFTDNKLTKVNFKGTEYWLLKAFADAPLEHGRVLAYLDACDENGKFILPEQYCSDGDYVYARVRVFAIYRYYKRIGLLNDLKVVFSE